MHTHTYIHTYKQTLHTCTHTQTQKTLILQYSKFLNVSITYSILRLRGAQWLRCCATNRKIAGSIPAGVSGFFIDIKSFRSH